MQGSATLALLAEVFIALAGFTGIVAALGQRSAGAWRPVDVIRFRAKLESSLAGLLFAIVPFGCFYIGVPESLTWRAGSALLIVYAWSIIIRTVHKQRQLRATADPDFVPGARLTIMIGAIPVSAALLMNAAGTSLVPAFGGYLIGLLFLLVLDCTMFVLLLRFIRAET